MNKPLITQLPHIMYMESNLTCMYEIKRLNDSTFDISGYYLSTDGAVRTILREPLHLDSHEWMSTTGWRESSSDSSIFQFTDPATDMPTDAKVIANNQGRDHYVELTDKTGRFVRILTTDNDVIIVLVAIAAVTC